MKTRHSPITRIVWGWALLMFVGAAPVRAKDPSFSWNNPFSSWVNDPERPHEVQIINEGTGALAHLLEMIGRADHEIDLEYYIFAPDRAGKMITQALLRRLHDSTRPPVLVRILLDGWHASSGKVLSPYYVAQLEAESYDPALQANRIQVRYYNRVSIFHYPRVNHRNHRKLCLIDGSEFQLGGRNIADEYLDLNLKLNFLDRDIWVKGPIAQDVQLTFDGFWGNNYSEPVPLPSKPHEPSGFGAPRQRDSVEEQYRLSLERYRSLMAQAARFLTESTPDDQELEQRVRSIGDDLLAKTPPVSVTSIGFVSDEPGRDVKSRMLGKEIDHQLSGVVKRLTIENYCLILKGDQKKCIDEKLKDGVEVHAVTNGFRSSELLIPEMLSYMREVEEVRRGMVIFRYSAKALDNRDYPDPRVKKARWSIHTKSLVWDGANSLVSSYNFDPRSRNLNAEFGVFVLGSKEVARAIGGSIIQRVEFSNRLKKNGLYQHDGKPAEDDDPNLLEWWFVTLFGEPLVDHF